MLRPGPPASTRKSRGSPRAESSRQRSSGPQWHLPPGRTDQAPLRPEDRLIIQRGHASRPARGASGIPEPPWIRQEIQIVPPDPSGESPPRGEGPPGFLRRILVPSLRLGLSLSGVLSRLSAKRGTSQAMRPFRAVRPKRGRRRSPEAPPPLQVLCAAGAGRLSWRSG